MSFKIYNTLGHKIEDFIPYNNGKLSSVLYLSKSLLLTTEKGGYTSPFSSMFSFKSSFYGTCHNTAVKIFLEKWIHYQKRQTGDNNGCIFQKFG